MPHHLTTLFCRHAAASFGKQMHLAGLVGDSDWHFDLPAGLLSFGDEYRWQVQVLGTEADDSRTWLWAWANEASGIPTQLLGSALTLRMLGDAVGLPELAEPEAPLARIDGHTLAMIGSGVCRAEAYYRCPYEGGAAFVLIKDAAFPGPADDPLLRLATVFPQAISAIGIPDHRLALMGWLDYYGIAVCQEGGALVVRIADKAVMTAGFDEQDRLTRLEVEIAPPLGAAE